MHRPSPATGISVVSLVVALSGTAYAATGGSLLLGRSNTATSLTSLSDPRGTALSVSSPAGKPALAVSNAIQIPRLNASLLQGRAATSFLGSHSTAVNADALQGSPASAFGAVESARINGVPSVPTPCVGPANCLTLNYGAVSGISTSSVTQTTMDSLSPDRAMVIRDLSVVVSSAPGTNNVLQVGVSINDAGGAAFSCLVVAASTTCSDGTDAASVPAGSRISIAVIDNQAAGSSGVPGESVLVGFRMSPA
ncbi:MAG TPA: hypothetical protein VGZ03_10890 [Acidimicrobiales bacterium]|nr:hypothetical protein [Acidimicrobiales bacterium]